MGTPTAVSAHADTSSEPARAQVDVVASDAALLAELLDRIFAALKDPAIAERVHGPLTTPELHQLGGPDTRVALVADTPRTASFRLTFDRVDADAPMAAEMQVTNGELLDAPAMAEASGSDGATPFTPDFLRATLPEGRAELQKPAEHHAARSRVDADDDEVDYSQAPFILEATNALEEFGWASAAPPRSDRFASARRAPAPFPAREVEESAAGIEQVDHPATRGSRFFDMVRTGPLLAVEFPAASYAPAGPALGPPQEPITAKVTRTMARARRSLQRSAATLSYVATDAQRWLAARTARPPRQQQAQAGAVARSRHAAHAAFRRMNPRVRPMSATALAVLLLAGMMALGWWRSDGTTTPPTTVATATTAAADLPAAVNATPSRSEASAASSATTALIAPAAQTTTAARGERRSELPGSAEPRQATPPPVLRTQQPRPVAAPATAPTAGSAANAARVPAKAVAGVAPVRFASDTKPKYRGTLEIASTPAGARVAIDGRPVGTTPLTLVDVPAGTRTLRIEADGFSRWARAVLVPADHKSKVAAVLQPARGAIPRQ